MRKPKTPTREGRFILIWHEIFESPAYRDLSLSARCLLTEFQRLYLPDRNGQLSISTRNAAKRLGCSETTAGNAFYELAEHGFLSLTEGHCWQQRKAREWRLTFEPCNVHEPTDEWKKWTPKTPYPVPIRKKSRPHNLGQTAPESRAEKEGAAPRSRAGFP